MINLISTLKKKIYYKPNNYKKLKSFLFNVFDRLSFLSISKKVKFSNGFVGKLPLSIDEINKFDIFYIFIGLTMDILI